MNDNVRKSLATGITRLKWIASYVARRTKAETSAAKKLYESSKIESRIDDIYMDIGKRVVELKEKNNKDETDVFRDFIIQKALDEIRNLKETMNEYKKQAKEANDIPE